jgi:hypothetical protein
MADRNFDVDEAVRQPISEYGGDISDVIESQATATVDVMKETAAGIRQKMDDAVQFVRDGGLRTLADDAASYLRAHPTQALIGAVVLGFWAGRMARRG